jgi:type II secretory pathway pseudopilin PulG
LNEEAILARSAIRSGTRRSATAGFSIVELVVSLCILLILTAMAVPSLMRSVRTYQLNSAAASVSDMLKFTRFEAVRQNKKVSFLLAPSGSGWIVWTGPGTDTAPSLTEKQFPISGFASLVTSGFPSGPAIAGTSTVLSGSSCTPACLSFDARGAVSPLQAYVLYIGSITDPDPGYRAVVLLPSGSTQIWSAPSAGPWGKIN